MEKGRLADPRPALTLLAVRSSAALPHPAVRHMGTCPPAATLRSPQRLSGSAGSRSPRAQKRPCGTRWRTRRGGTRIGRGRAPSTGPTLLYTGARGKATVAKAAKHLSDLAVAAAGRLGTCVTSRSHKGFPLARLGFPCEAVGHALRGCSPRRTAAPCNSGGGPRVG